MLDCMLTLPLDIGTCSTVEDSLSSLSLLDVGTCLTVGDSFFSSLLLGTGICSTVEGSLYSHLWSTERWQPWPGLWEALHSIPLLQV